MNLDQLLYDSVETVDINKSILKIGCLFACVLQKKGMVIFKYSKIFIHNVSWEATETN